MSNTVVTGTPAAPKPTVSSVIQNDVNTAVNSFWTKSKSWLQWVLVGSLLANVLSVVGKVQGWW